ncbi:MAG: site-specific tyrosine recombinase XerC [Methanosaeta sp. PtaU1.Bin060]|nr:MAG: site-specific tyrosine recombinase XerC [Methanosaeta sp. PtaU1.Bin060]
MDNLIERFEADCRLRHLKAVDTYLVYVRDFARLQSDLAHPSRDALKAYLEVLRGRQMKYSSIVRAFASLSAFYEFLVAEGEIESNPIRPFRSRYIRAYKEDAMQDRRQLISVEDATKIVSSTLKTRDRAIIVLLLKTGMRQGELRALDVGDVDLEKGEVRLKPTAKRSNRLLFLDQESIRVLGAWLQARKHQRLNGCTALFPSLQARRLSNPQLIYIVSQAAERVRLHDPNSNCLEKRFTPHCCRHWFTTHLLRAGMKREHVAWLRGDHDGSAIMTYYHIDPEDVRRSYLACIPQLGI